MPYKHIAAHLQKTELACRLHYHQLSFGTKRRRRASSSSSNRSGNSSNGNSSGGPEPASQQSTPPSRTFSTISPPESPESKQQGSSTHSNSPQHPIPILPKPRNTTLDRSRCLPPPSSNALGLITYDDKFEERGRVDRERLARLYDAHRGPFWNAIARDYGEGAAPALLEDVWLQQQPPYGPALPAAPARFGPGGALPPTPPNGSPSSTQAQIAPNPAGTPAPLEPSFTELPPPNTFSPINGPSRSVQNTPNLPARSSFAISSLLTEDKTVRSQRP